MARRRSDKGNLRWKGDTLYWCGTVPVGTDAETGKVVWGYRERSTGASDEREAWKRGREIQAEFLEALSRPLKKKPAASMTLIAAIHLYLKAVGRNGEYLEKFVDDCPNMPINEIDQGWLDERAERYYPGRTAATKNRAVYTPMSAVLNHVASVVKDFNPPRIKRPRGWLPPSNFKKPPDDWWARVVPHCSPGLEAFLWFTHAHLRRVSEACSIRPEDIDPVTWKVTLWDSKEEQWISLQLAEPVIKAFDKYEWRKKKYVFGFCDKGKVRKALVKACAKAGVPYHVPKDVGRHSGASHLLGEGCTTKEVAEAGRWKSTRMVDKVYGHLEKRSVDEKVRNLNEKWAKKQIETAEVITSDFPLISRQGNR